MMRRCYTSRRNDLPYLISPLEMFQFVLEAETADVVERSFYC